MYEKMLFLAQVFSNDINSQTLI